MRKILSASLALALLGGCVAYQGEAPSATNFQTENQNKLQAGAHWGTIAANVAEQIKKSTSKDTSVYVTAPRRENQFSRAFHNQLISSLVNQGVFVTKTYDNQALIVEIDTQMVNQNFAPDRIPRREVLVTTSASKNAQYVMRRTDVYYVSDNDMRLYQDTNISKNIPVKGDQ